MEVIYRNKSDTMTKIEKNGIQKLQIYYKGKSNLKRFRCNKTSSGL